MNIIKRFRKSFAALLVIFCVLAFGAESCDDNSKSTADNETKTQQDSYAGLAKEQPAVTMAYSSTRDTVIGWIKTWGQKGKVSYVYLTSNGKPYAFAVLKGLPVSYCVSLTPNYQIIKPHITGDDNVPLQVPAPGVDGVYYSGGDCQRYYGFDATTGGYFEFSAGADTTMVIRDQPFPLNLYADALPLGDTTAEQAQTADDTKAIVPVP